MGADFCGYTVFFPEKAGKLVTSHLDKLEAMLAGAEDRWAGEWGIPDKEFKALEKFGVDMDSLNGGGDEPENTLASLRESIAIAREFTDFKPGQYGHRDGTESVVCVNGVKVSIMTAGEMSWGDEPEGAGYECLRALVRTGLEMALYKSIPWDARRGKKK